jgi:hypothetical protein
MSLNVYTFCNTFVIAVVNAFHGLAINTDYMTGMCNGTGISIRIRFLTDEAFTTGFFAAAGMLATYHYIPLGTKLLSVIHATFCTTF